MRTGSEQELFFGICIGFLLGLIIVGVVGIRFDENNIVAGYNQKFKCSNETQVVKTSKNGYVLAKTCEVVERND